MHCTLLFSPSSVDPASQSALHCTGLFTQGSLVPAPDFSTFLLTAESRGPHFSSQIQSLDEIQEHDRRGLFTRPFPPAHDRVGVRAGMLLSTPAQSLIPKDSFSSLLHLFQVTLILALFPHFGTSQGSVRLSTASTPTQCS